MRSHTRGTSTLVILALVGLGACTAPAADVDSEPAETTSALGEHTLIPASATLERVAEVPLDPMADDIHPDPRQAEMIRLGYQISQDPQTYASEFVGNDLTGGNCHLNAGQRDRALPLLGVAAAFPHG